MGPAGFAENSVKHFVFCACKLVLVVVCVHDDDACIAALAVDTPCVREHQAPTYCCNHHGTKLIPNHEIFLCELAFFSLYFFCQRLLINIAFSISFKVQSHQWFGKFLFAHFMQNLYCFIASVYVRDEYVVCAQDKRQVCDAQCSNVVVYSGWCGD